MVQYNNPYLWCPWPVCCLSINSRTLQKISANMTSVLKIKALKSLVATADVHWSIFQAFIKSKEVICYKNNILKISCPWTSVRTPYLLTPWSRVLLEKLTGLQLVKKFPAFYGARRFITAFTSARHLSLSWASSIQSIPPHPTSWRSILILSSQLHLGLPGGLFPSGFPTKTHHHKKLITNVRNLILTWTMVTVNSSPLYHFKSHKIHTIWINIYNWICD